MALTLNSNKFLIFLLSALIFLAVAQITLGGIVRVTGSGDACPDWPTCMGSWIPPLDDWRVGLEWGHRTVGTFLGIWAIFTVIFALIKYRKIFAMPFSNNKWWRVIPFALINYRKWQLVVASSIITLILITITGVVGGTVVLNDLNPALRTLHLLGAQFVILFAVLGLIAEMRPATFSKRKFNPKRGNYLAGGLLVAILVIIVSGAYAVWQGAGLVCSSWPVCNFSDGALPSGELEWINITHRIVTGVATVAVLLIAHHIMRRSSGLVRFATIAVMVGIMVEIVLGAAVASTIRIGTAPDSDLLWLLNMWRGMHIGFSSVVWAAACIASVGWIFYNLAKLRAPDTEVEQVRNGAE